MDDNAKRRPATAGMLKQRGFEAARAPGQANKAVHVAMPDEQRSKPFGKVDVNTTEPGNEVAEAAGAGLCGMTSEPS